MLVLSFSIKSSVIKYKMNKASTGKNWRVLTILVG